ncbi:MAG: hypothetical protein KZQ65_10120 [Candidatus Thiodiazotropha sp. (ex Gloverina cf. vestifex)]|nr:hypothetical protein [Candidatus Thiodiazotropha sp. (ex Gloverina cf. vestifex)]
MRSLYALHRSLTVTITAIQPRLRLSGTNRLGFQPSMAISDGFHRRHSPDPWQWPYRFSVRRCCTFLRFHHRPALLFARSDTGLSRT